MSAKRRGPERLLAGKGVPNKDPGDRDYWPPEVDPLAKPTGRPRKKKGKRVEREHGRPKDSGRSGA